MHCLLPSLLLNVEYAALSDTSQQVNLLLANINKSIGLIPQICTLDYLYTTIWEEADYHMGRRSGRYTTAGCYAHCAEASFPLAHCARPSNWWLVNAGCYGHCLDAQLSFLCCVLHIDRRPRNWWREKAECSLHCAISQGPSNWWLMTAKCSAHCTMS